jgi:tetratricopeptide (TPR) repeat protein
MTKPDTSLVVTVLLRSAPCCAILVILTTLSPFAMASEWRAIGQNNDGVDLFAKSRVNDAYQHFLQALGAAPFSSTVHLNLGTTFLANKEYEKALSEFQEAVRLSQLAGSSRRESEVQFQAYFNAGVAATELKRTEEALNNYQRALDIHSDSLEAKTNIELLTKDGGGGGGDKDQQDKNKQNKDGKNQSPKDQNKPDSKPDSNQQKDKPRATPKPFQSQDLTQQDVGRILEELKRQEEQVRARMNRENGREAPLERDW